MPSVLGIIASRAANERRVVEGKKGETIDLREGSGGILVTGCSGCTITAPGKSSNVTIERCDDTMVHVGTVVASLEIIRCKAVQLSIQRGRTITVDMSTKVSLSCKCQPSAEQTLETEAEETKTHPSLVADEASAVRLFTSCSDEVSITFEGISSSNSSSEGDSESNASSRPVTYAVPKDSKYEKGDGPRSVTRITVDRSATSVSRCKTLRCDQYGTPLEEAEAIEDGVAWTWENGRAS